jgi:hypothetical protein
VYCEDTGVSNEEGRGERRKTRLGNDQQTCAVQHKKGTGEVHRAGVDDVRAGDGDEGEETGENEGVVGVSADVLCDVADDHP